MKSQFAVAIIAFALLAIHEGSARCSAPDLTPGVEYVSGKANTMYSSGSKVYLKCSTEYGYKSGSYNGTCNSNDMWNWPTGAQLECDPACPAPELPDGVEFASENSSGYILNDVIALRCSSGYISAGGGESAVCLANNTWQWNGTGMLQCLPDCSCQKPPTLTTGVYFTVKPVTYQPYETIGVACDLSYVATGGNGSGVCSDSCLWSWGTNDVMLQCTRGCLAPNLTEGVEYVSGNETTAYLSGSTVSLKCSTKYGYRNGSYTGSCSNNLTWDWETGEQLECDPACPAPQLLVGVEFASGNSLVFIVNDGIELRCGEGYTSTGGSAFAVCLANNTWQWSDTGMLRCSPACLPPAAGVNATISASFSKSLYIVNETIQFECVSGYVPSSGSSSGVCSSVNQWTWLTGATAPLNCIIAPPYKDRLSDSFEPSTCQHYVSRTAPTSSTCLLSCLYDGYCSGYAFDADTCYLDRPLIEPTVESSKSCFTRR